MDILMLKLLTAQPAQTNRRKLSQVGLMFARTLGVHGEDDRIEISKLEAGFSTHDVAREAAHGVALLTSDSAIALSENDARLITNPTTPRGLFPNEPCISLTYPATAFLVTERHAVTAAHAVAFRDPRLLNLVFGFDSASTLAPDDLSYTLPRAQVVGVKQIVALVYDSQLGDIAVLELDDTVPIGVGRPLPLAPARSTTLLQEVAMISHARAQPQKAIVRKKDDPQPWRFPRVIDQDERFIYTNLDSFRGCSGSPVLDTQGRVVGVQFRGESETDSEAVATVLPEEAAGSAATRIEVIRDILEALGAPLPPS